MNERTDYELATSARTELLGYLLGAADRDVLEEAANYYQFRVDGPEATWIVKRLERELVRRDADDDD
jgi:hypothetical protein